MFRFAGLAVHVGFHTICASYLDCRGARQDLSIIQTPPDRYAAAKVTSGMTVSFPESYSIHLDIIRCSGEWACTTSRAAQPTGVVPLRLSSEDDTASISPSASLGSKTRPCIEAAQPVCSPRSTTARVLTATSQMSRLRRQTGRSIPMILSQTPSTTQTRAEPGDVKQSSTRDMPSAPLATQLRDTCLRPKVT